MRLWTRQRKPTSFSFPPSRYQHLALLNFVASASWFTFYLFRGISLAPSLHPYSPTSCRVPLEHKSARRLWTWLLNPMKRCRDYHVQGTIILLAKEAFPQRSQCGGSGKQRVGPILHGSAVASSAALAACKGATQISMASIEASRPV